MKHRLLLIALLLATPAWLHAAAAALGREVLVEAESFAQPGGWVVDQQALDQMGSAFMLAYIGGKRESRRLLGDVILRQQDIVEARPFPDASVTTTWTIDLHYPKNTIPMNVVMIVPTGIGCEIGGHCGDGNAPARLLGACCGTLVLHPNVVNASDLNEMPGNARYVEGHRLGQFLLGKLFQRRVRSNKVLVVVNKAELSEPPRTPEVHLC